MQNYSQFDTPSQVKFEGTPTRKSYYSHDSSWGRYVVETSTQLPFGKRLYDEKDFMQDIVTYSVAITGKMPELNLGMTYTFVCTPKTSQKYGNSYETISVTQNTPKTEMEQMNFLSTITTPNQAKTLLDLYPNIVEDVINGKDNVDLTLTKGIKEITWEKIKTNIIENYAIADILVLLIPLGVTYRKIQKLLDGEPNPQILKQRLLDDPYVLAELPGISFKIADDIAIKIDPNFIHSTVRTDCFMNEYLKNTAEETGHTWIEKEELDNAVFNDIVECKDLYEERLEKQRNLDYDNREKMIYFEDNKIGLKYYHFVETEIWDTVNRLNESEPLKVSDEAIENGIKKANEFQGFDFSEEQVEILKGCVKNNFTMITGKAGSGKTSLARGLLNIYHEAGYFIASCALSAKAAIRIKEVTGFESTTIHRLLGATGVDQFKYNRTNLLEDIDVVFIDEASMIYAGLIHSVLVALKPTTKVIFCGDPKQLPPIGYGNVFANLLEKDHLQINYLTKIYRQSQDSGIISGANKIREGISPVEKPTQKFVDGVLQDMFYLFRDSRDSLNDIAIKTFMRSVEQVGIDNVFIIVPRKRDCINSTKEINKQIQNLRFPDPNIPGLKYGETIYRLGDKVIHIKNNYEKSIFNGEIGYIVEVDVVENMMLVKYAENRFVQYAKDELNEIDLAYSISCHKAQGSQAHTIIFIIDNTHFTLLNRSLLYTGITRATTRCVLLAEPSAYRKALENDLPNNRKTWLKEFQYSPLTEW